jgi:hypothetical protein
MKMPIELQTVCAPICPYCVFSVFQDPQKFLADEAKRERKRSSFAEIHVMLKIFFNAL